MNPKIKEYLEKLGNILLTALISAVIAWLQAILADQSAQEIAQASPEVAGATGALLRGVIESTSKRV